MINVGSSIREILKRINSLLDVFRYDFDKGKKIAIGVSLFLALIAFVTKSIPAIQSITFILEFVVLFWFFLQPTDGLDEEYINDTRFKIFLVIFASMEAILIAQGLQALATEIILFVAFYAIITLSLNLSTGLVGVLNFGVVAQVAVGSVTFGILTVNYNYNIIIAAIFAILASAIFSGIIAFTTLKLRDDYFAIVSITVGEIFRQILKTEPTTRGPIRSNGLPPSTPGILLIPQPLREGYDSLLENTLLNGTLLHDLGYRFFLGIIGLILLLIVFYLANLLLNSPYGRLLRGIREDEGVASTYGKNVFRKKVEILMISGAIAGLGGVYMTWIFSSIFPENFVPIMTFYAWTVLIIGGTGNNKGVIVGAISFIMLQRMSLRYNDQDSFLVSLLEYIVGIVNPNPPRTVSVAYFQLIIVGLVLILFIRYAPRGMVAEERFRPTIRGLKLPPPGSQSELQGATSDNESEGDDMNA